MQSAGVWLNLEVIHDCHDILVEKSTDQIDWIGLDNAFLQAFLDGVIVEAKEFSRLTGDFV